MQSQEPTTIFPLAATVPEVASVPRRFGVGVLLVLVTMFGVLFAVLSSFRVPQAACAVVGVLFVGVAAGQALLFGGQKPREASICIGGILFPLSIMVVTVYMNHVGPRRERVDLAEMIPGLFCAVPAGCLFGYLAGTLTAGIFLAMGRLRKQDATLPKPSIRLRPFTADDIDTLAGWVRSHWLMKFWAADAFSFPLDGEELKAHLSQARGDPPRLFVFKAICRHSGRMVGYVELGQINYELRSARLQHALVDPSQLQRGWLSVALIRAVLRIAFGELRLRRVGLTVPRIDREAVACYRRAGFLKEGVLRDAFQIHGVYHPAQIMSILYFDWRWRTRDH